MYIATLKKNGLFHQNTKETYNKSLEESSKMSKIFSERLRAARALKGLSQTDLAKKTNLQPSAISHFENDRRSPSFDNLKRLADALEVTVDYLLGRAEEPKNLNLVSQQLFRDFKQMTENDKDTLTKMAKMLADKNKNEDKS